MTVKLLMVFGGSMYNVQSFSPSLLRNFPDGVDKGGPYQTHLEKTIRNEKITVQLLNMFGGSMFDLSASEQAGSDCRINVTARHVACDNFFLIL